MLVSSPTSRALVITGASTGIGEACALKLDRLGYRVFATVRSPQDAESLRRKASASLMPVIMDVAEQDSITRAAETLREAVGEEGIGGLVNNAGIAIAGPLEFIPLDDLRWQIEVNLIGQVAVTQALMPLLRKGSGRIVYMGSIGGRSSMPFYGPYSASKFALEAITDALRVELRPWRLHVAIIEPGAIDTPIWDKSIGKTEAGLDSYSEITHRLYGHWMRAMFGISRRAGERGIPAEEVAKAVVHALTAPRPKNRYLIGRDTRTRLLLELLPGALRDALIARTIEANIPAKP